MLIRLIKKLIGWAIFLLIIVVIIDQFVIPWYVRQNSQIILPGVIGKNFSEAKKILESQGFQIIRSEEIVNPKFLPGTVIDQYPEPKSTVKKGRRIYVTLSTAEGPIRVPNVIGQSERDAYLIMNETGLKVDSTVFYDYNSLYPEGVVSNQSIYEGAQVQRGATAKITLSLGPLPRDVKVPNFTLQNLGTVKRNIARAGLTLGKVMFQANTKYLPNTVLEQSLEPGKVVPPGEIVDVVVSTLDTTAQSNIQ